ncbi:MAG: DUF5011 domain-containing protein [Bacteroidetes bacterium]|nr:DUF5011 domain-containing protein [Bacteroidota bacterium]
MKKQLFLAAAVLFTAGIIWMTGCKKEDTTPPVVTLTGSASMSVSLQSATTDPGATAEDDEDGTITASSDWSSTNPNLNYVGVYTITYTATDAAGNSNTATRTVTVYNQASMTLAGTYLSSGVSYTVKDSIVALPPNTTFPQTVTFDNSTNNKIHFNKFANYSNNAGIFATIDASGSITLPSQSPTGIGSASETHTFQGTGTVTGTKFTLHFTDVNVTGGGTADDYEWFN